MADLQRSAIGGAGAITVAPATIGRVTPGVVSAITSRLGADGYVREADSKAAERPITIFVLSPYPSVRAGLRVLLDADRRFDVIGEGPLFETLSPAKAGVAPDVIVVDLPSLEALDSLIADAATLPDSALVLLGPLPDDARPLVRLGGRAWAYLPRDADGAELASAVVAVESGLLAIDPSIAVRLLAPGVAVRQPSEGGEIEDLTARELEVLALLAEGIPNKAIARRLGISDHTVKFHVGSLLGKMGAASRTEAVRIGAQRGLIAL